MKPGWTQLDGVSVDRLWMRPRVGFGVQSDSGSGRAATEAIAPATPGR